MSKKFFITAIIAGLLLGIGLTSLAQTECKKEGETIPVIAEPPSCCEGLILIPPKEPGIIGISGICTAKCGNGICDPETESAYNCPDDCEEALDKSINIDVALDENVSAEDLEIKEPKLLPDSPFYFLKNWSRGIRSFFTFNPIAKAELKQKFANEKLIELKKLTERKKDAEIIKKATENYQREIEKVKAAAEKIKQKAEENPKVDKFLNKFVKHQALHQRVLGKLENQVPPEAFEKIEQARERHLERFGEVMTKLEEKEKIGERLEENLEKIKGSKYKNFRNLEVLAELEEKVPEQAKEAIQKAQESTLKRLKGDLEKMSPEDQERFKKYLDKISGEKEKQLEIIENLRLELKESPEIREKLIETRERIMEKVEERVRGVSCPKIEKPATGFCQEGRIVVRKDDKGCIISFECVIPAEVEIPPEPEKPEPIGCVTLWNPVCGKNNRTYSNACFAKLAGVEIAYRGECKKIECRTDADCPQPRCGPAGTVSARCIGVKAKCVQGRCLIESIQSKPIEVQP